MSDDKVTFHGKSGPIKTIHKDTYPAIDSKQPHLSTTGKNVVISGGARGLGLAIAKAFGISKASSIALLGRSKSALNDAQKSLEQEFPDTKVFIYATDTTDKASVDAAFATMKQAIGTLDVLIANAGYMAEFSNIMEADAEEWMKSFDVNVRGNFNLLRAFRTVAANDAAIVNISAGLAHEYAPGCSSYACSKMAAAKMFDFFHREHPDMFVLAIHPGVLETDMYEKNPWKHDVDTDASKLALLCKDLPVDMYVVELPANYCVWAVSPEAKFLNGKFVWASWDVEEMKAVRPQVEGSDMFTLGLLGL